MHESNFLHVVDVLLEFIWYRVPTQKIWVKIRPFQVFFNTPTVVYLMPHTHVTNHNYKKQNTLKKMDNLFQISYFFFNCFLN